MISETLKNWDRVIKLSKKPRRDEFITISKITALGMLLVGFIGFVIRMVIQLTGINL